MDYLNFPTLNQQALDFIKERKEPETALDLLRQALPKPSRSTPLSISSHNPLFGSEKKSVLGKLNTED